MLAGQQRPHARSAVLNFFFSKLAPPYDGQPRQSRRIRDRWARCGEPLHKSHLTPALTLSGLVSPVPVAGSRRARASAAGLAAHCAMGLRLRLCRETVAEPCRPVAARSESPGRIRRQQRELGSRLLPKQWQAEASRSKQKQVQASNKAAEQARRAQSAVLRLAAPAAHAYLLHCAAL